MKASTTRKKVGGRRGWDYTLLEDGRGVVRRGRVDGRIFGWIGAAAVLLFATGATGGFAIHAAISPDAEAPILDPVAAPIPREVEPDHPDPVRVEPKPVTPEPTLPNLELPPPDDEEPPAETGVELDRVVWATDRALTLRRVTRMWGVDYEEVRRLNPWVDQLGRLPVGTELVVYERDEDEPTYSLGAPNRGGIVHGMPMPEGAAWAFRSGQRRMFGSRVAVESLYASFTRYGEQYPEGPRIRLGDMSRAEGGPLKPHRSHQSGRDVDINFVLLPDERLEEKWRRATVETFDGERNWFLFKSMVDTQNVQLVFMAAQARDLLWNAALEDLLAEDVEEYFRVVEVDATHRDHMHVRFLCDEGADGCYAFSVADRTTVEGGDALPDVAADPEAD